MPAWHPSEACRTRGPGMQLSAIKHPKRVKGWRGATIAHPQVTQERISRSAQIEGMCPQIEGECPMLLRPGIPARDARLLKHGHGVACTCQDRCGREPGQASPNNDHRGVSTCVHHRVSISFVTGMSRE